MITRENNPDEYAYLAREAKREADPDPPRTCELGECDRIATVYGGWPGADDWAGYACETHALAAGPSGYVIWEEVQG